MTGSSMMGSLLGAAASLGLWVVLAFVVAVPSGWVHLPLALGATLIAKAIVDADPGAAPSAQEGSGGEAAPRA